MNTKPTPERAPPPPSELPLRELLVQASRVMRWSADRAAFGGQMPRTAQEAYAFADALGDMADAIGDRAALATPDLLECLIGASNYIDTLGGDSKRYRGAIAKATGEQA